MSDGRSEPGRDLRDRLSPAGQGVGPLLQRDYWAAVSGSRLKPSEIMEQVRRHFASFAPRDLASFTADCGARGLQLGDEMDIRIAGAGECRVRLVHGDAQSLTLATMEGHPEMGRITFGAYRDEQGRVLFHIRSRARSDSLLRLFGFYVAGEAMQTNTWTQFVSRVAALCGGGVEGSVHAETKHSEADSDPPDQPTFLARGD